MSAPVTSPQPPAPSAAARRLGIAAEPKSEADWRISVLVAGKDGKYQRRKGAITARRIRDLASAHQMRMESRRLHASKRPSPPLERSPIRIEKRLEGEAKNRRMPTLPLHPKYGRYIRWCAKALGWSLDALCFPLRNMKAQQVVKGLLLKMSVVLLVVAVAGYLFLTALGGMLGRAHSPAALVSVAAWLRILFPLAFGSAGLSGVAMGIRIRLGRRYRVLLKPWSDPAPAWKDEPVFTIGKVTRILSDFYEGTIVFGGTGSGKTASVISPLLLQWFRKLNNPDPNAVDARFFALMLDVKGNFADLVVYLMLQVKRPLTDLIFVDPDLDLYRYNPLDPTNPDFAQNGAATLKAINTIMGNDSKGGDNVYWDNTSKNVIEYLLKNLSIVRPKNRIGLDDVGRFVRDGDRVGALIKQARAVLDIKRRKNSIGIDEYNEMCEAVSELQNNWAELDGRTKGILKTTIAIMLGPIPTNPRLQRVFCRDTNFSMREVINDGKIVIFRGGSLDFQTARMISVCLKRDFQWWTRRRIGKQGRDLGLNDTRPGAFVADEFQELVTCGGEGDETYFGVCRDSKIMSLVGTQGRSSLDVAIKNPAQLQTLLNNLTTKIFLKMSDKETQEMGSFHAGKFHREKERVTVYHGNLAGAMAQPMSGKGGHDYSTMVDESLEEYFRPDEFAKLVTVPKRKSVSGPWYSEGIVYNYSETNGELVSWSVKTRLMHLYPNREMQTLTAKYFDDLLYARNAQAKTYRMFYMVAAAGIKARETAQAMCDGQAGSVRKQIEDNANRAADARPQTETEIRDRVLAQHERVSEESEKALADLREYERTVGIHGPRYGELRAKTMQLLAQRTALEPLVGPIRHGKAILAGGTVASRQLMDGRGVDAMLERANERGIPQEIVEGSKQELKTKGPSTGVTPRAGHPNALEYSQSALPGEPAGGTPNPGVGNPPPPPPKFDPGELEKLIQRAAETPQAQSEYQRQIKNYDARFSVPLDDEYNRRFPPNEPKPVAAPPPPPPGKAASPPLPVPLPENAAEKAELVDKLTKTTEEDYA